MNVSIKGVQIKMNSHVIIHFILYRKTVEIEAIMLEREMNWNRFVVC